MMYKELLIKNKINLYSFFAFVIAGVSIGLVVPGFLDMVVVLGHNIPQDDLATDYVTAVVWAIVLGMSILAWPVPFRDKKDLLWVWFAKILMVLGFMLIYESHYSAMDTYSYFNGPRQSDYVWEGIKLWGSYKNMMSLIWLHHQVLPESFHALKLSFAMIGLVAVYLFYRAAVIFLQREVKHVFYALALFPSILFMSSTIGKEPVVLLGIALYIYGFVGWYRLKQMRYLLVLMLGATTIMFLRLWLVPILLMPSAIVLLLSGSNRVVKIAFVVLACFVLWFSLHQVVDWLGIETIEGLVKKVDSLAIGFRRGGSQIGNTRFTSIGDIVAFAPIGAFTALFRPLPGEVLSPFGLLASIENVALLMLLWTAVKRTRWRELQEPMVIWAILLVLTWATVYGFLSQNLGTVVRYKLQILPVLLGLLLYLSRRRLSGTCASKQIKELRAK